MARSRIVFATFNLRNLQLPGAPVYGDENFYSEEDFRAKRAWIAARLVEIDADVIGFQEVWSEAALKDCFGEAGLLDAYDFAARDAPNSGSIQVALAVRKGRLREGFEWIEPFPAELRLRKRPPKRPSEPNHAVDVRMDSFSRPVLRAVVKAPGRSAPDIQIYVAHLKSKRPIDLDAPERQGLASEEARAIGEALSLIRRGAEAAALRLVLGKAMTGNDVPTVVLGDLNDDVLAVTTTIVTGDPSYKLFATSPIGKKATKIGDYGLYSTQVLQEYRSLRDVTYTYIYKNKMEVLDHIMVSEQFYDHSLKRIWAFRELKVWNDYLERAKRDKAVTDHAIVAAVFEFAPLKVEAGEVRAVVAAEKVEMA